MLGRSSRRDADRVQAKLEQARKGGPFRRNDDMLSVMPVGVIIFPGSGITKKLRDKARAFGITGWELKGGGA